MMGSAYRTRRKTRLNSRGSTSWTFSDHLFMARCKCGLTQREVSVLSGIGLSTIKQYEAGLSYPTVPRFALLQNTLNFDARELVRAALLEAQL